MTEGPRPRCRRRDRHVRQLQRRSRPALKAQLGRNPLRKPLRQEGPQRHDATLRLPGYIRRAGQDIIGHEPSARTGTMPA